MELPIPYDQVQIIEKYEEILMQMKWVKVSKSRKQIMKSRIFPTS